MSKIKLSKAITVYSPETCLLIPQRINMIFMEKSKGKDSDLPNCIRRCVTVFNLDLILLI